MPKTSHFGQHEKYIDQADISSDVKTTFNSSYCSGQRHFSRCPVQQAGLAATATAVGSLGVPDK